MIKKSHLLIFVEIYSHKLLNPIKFDKQSKLLKTTVFPLKKILKR